MHLPHDQRRDAAPLLVGLSALGFRSAVHDLRPALPLGEGQAQYPRRHRGAAVQATAAQREAAREPLALGRRPRGRPAWNSLDFSATWIARAQRISHGRQLTNELAWPMTP